METFTTDPLPNPHRTTQPSINQGLRGSKTRKNFILAQIPTRFGWDGALTEKRYE